MNKVRTNKDAWKESVISRNTRPARAGRHMAESIIEMAHILYLDDNALEYLLGAVELLAFELERRKKEYAAKKHMKSS